MSTGKMAGRKFAALVLALTFSWVIVARMPARVGAVGEGPPETKELYFTQLADGGGYATQFLLVNPSNADITGTLDLFKSDGAPLPITLDGSRNSSFPVTLKARGTLVLKSANSDAQVQIGWARVKSSAPIGGALICSYSSGGRLIEEAGLDPSIPANNFSLFVDTRNGYSSGLAIANPNPAAVTLTLALYDPEGNRLAQETRQLEAMQHFAKLAGELFPSRDLGSFSGTITVQAAEGVVFGTTLRFDADLNLLASIPVIDVSGNPDPNLLYFPHIADGGGYRTAFSFVNPNATAISANLELFKQDGTPLSLNLKGQTGSSHTIAIPGNGSFFAETANAEQSTLVGWARVKSDGPLGGSVVFAYEAGGKTVAETGINPATSASDFVLPMNRREGIWSKLAVVNPGDSDSAALTLSLYDAVGTQKGTTATRDLGARNQFALLLDEIFPEIDLTDFVGSLVVKSNGAKVACTALRFDREVSTLSSIPVFVGLASVPATAGWITPAPLRAGQFGRMVVFGDSHSDVGNTLLLGRPWITVFPSPPYYNGRCTNGPNWIDVLAESLGLPAPTASSAGGANATNYAYAGAEVVGSFYGVPSLQDQVKGFLSIDNPRSTDLVIFRGGGNDFVAGGQNNPGVPAGAIKALMVSLNSRGARNFLVVNLAPMGNDPGMRGTASEKYLNDLSSRYGALLGSHVADLRAQFGTSVSLYEFNTYGFVQRVLANPGDFGLTNVSDLAMKSLSSIVANPDQYWYWDTYGHWTRAGYRLEAQFMTR